MAKAIVTFEDQPDGTVQVSCKFDPEMQMKDDSDVSTAQWLALKAMKAAVAQGDDHEEEAPEFSDERQVGDEG